MSLEVGGDDEVTLIGIADHVTPHHAEVEEARAAAADGRLCHLDVVLEYGELSGAAAHGRLVAHVERRAELFEVAHGLRALERHRLALIPTIEPLVADQRI